MSDRAASSRPSPPESPVSAAILGRPVRVLLVEDNAVNRRVAGGILGKLGCEIHEAENGEIALRHLAEGTFDLVFMDVQMPVLDGFQATQSIRANPGWRDLPIIAMTAHAMKGDREKCMEAGMSDYIAKPVRFEEIRDMINKWTARVAGSSIVSVENPPVEGELSGTTKHPPIDVEQALLNLGGDRTLLNEVLSAFVETIPRQLADLQIACAEKDIERLEAIAHSLKGSASNVCAEPVRRLALQMEELSRGPDPQSVLTMMPELAARLRELQACAAELNAGYESSLRQSSAVK